MSHEAFVLWVSLPEMPARQTGRIHARPASSRRALNATSQFSGDNKLELHPELSLDPFFFTSSSGCAKKRLES